MTTTTETPESTTYATSGGSTLLPRDRWGRPIVTTPDGKQVAYTRVTTIAGTLDEMYGLMGWKQRQTAVGLAARKDLLLRAASLGPQPMAPVGPRPSDPAARAAWDAQAQAKRTWKAQMDDVCESAMEASASSSSATIGTALHTYTEAIDTARVEGRVWSGNVPTEFAPHLLAYQEATKDLQMHAMEQFVVNDDLMAGGTLDRLVVDPNFPGLLIADVKTGSMEYPHKMAMQLAMYAHSMVFDPITATRHPIEGINQDVGIIIALDALTGLCSLQYIDIRSGWEAVRLALKVREWRKKDNLLAPVESVKPLMAMEPPAVEAPAEPEPVVDQSQPTGGVVIDMAVARAKAAMQTAIANAVHQGELIDLAEAAKAQGVWSDDLNAAAAARWPDLPPF